MHPLLPLGFCKAFSAAMGAFGGCGQWELALQLLAELAAQGRGAAMPFITGFWLAGNEGVEKNMETTIMGYLGTTTRIHSFIPS